MSKNSYAESINSAKLMIAGLTANADRVAKRGIQKDFIAKLSDIQQQAGTLDNEQESLKAQLKTKTAELDTRMKDMDKLMSEAKKTVKLEMEKSTWKEFGIQDSK